MLEAIRRLLHRRRCLRAWRTDIERHSGSAQARADIAHRYNRWRFWWQRRLPICGTDRPHEWRDTRINPFGIATEQNCTCCGARRHLYDPRDVMPIDGPPKWREGPHPHAIT